MRRPLLLLALTAACAPDVSIAPDIKDPDPGPDTDVELPVDQPDILVEPAELRFGALPPNCGAIDQEVTVTNVGDADLVVDDIVLKGASKAAYTVRGRARTLAPGDAMVVTVGFTAADYQAYNDARVEVLSNDPDEPTSQVDLLGEGAVAAFKEEVFIQDQAGGVDVLFSIDYSGSMSNEISALGNRFQTFIDAFVNLGLDYRIGVISADPSPTCASFAGPIITPATPDPKAEFVAQTATRPCGVEAAFGASKAALTAPLIDNENKDFLRTDATLAVVALSDEPEQSGITPTAYVNWLVSMKGGDASRVSFSGIVGPDGSGVFPVCRGEVERAPQYHAAIRQSGGVWGDICSLNLDPFLIHLSYVASGLEYRFELDILPLSATPQAITVEVDGVAVPFSSINGWTYDAATNAVELHGNAIPDPGSVVVVRYPYEAECQ